MPRLLSSKKVKISPVSTEKEYWSSGSETSSVGSGESIVGDDTLIGFGKLKGRKHLSLIFKDNAKYAKWIIDQGHDFRYGTTRQYIIDNLVKRKDVEVREAIRTLSTFRWTPDRSCI